MRFFGAFCWLLLAACSRREPQQTALPEAPPPSPAVEGTARAPGVAVLELFTSEGCSSCPSADDNLARVASSADESGQHIYTLSFHVDYWNDLGWADPFSSADYSTRQRRYAAWFSTGRIYTPQLVVNGREQFVGSDRSQTDDAVQRALATPAAVTVKLTPSYESDKRLLSVSYELAGNRADTQLSWAIVQDADDIQVKSGENHGRELSHANVVRVFDVQAKFAERGIWRSELPRTVAPEKASVVAYLQRTSEGRIVGAASAPLVN